MLLSFFEVTFITASRQMNRTPPNTPTRVVSLSRPVTNRVDVKKLLLSKWTAVKPIDKCKHFLVVQVIAPEPPNLNVQWVELEAVHSNGVQRVRWHALRDRAQWRHGWV